MEYPFWLCRSEGKKIVGLNIFSVPGNYLQWQVYIVKFWTHAPPPRFNYLHFHAVLGKFGKIIGWHPS